jgi:hypothetical protein
MYVCHKSLYEHTHARANSLTKHVRIHTHTHIQTRSHKRAHKSTHLAFYFRTSNRPKQAFLQGAQPQTAYIHTYTHTHTHKQKFTQVVFYGFYNLQDAVQSVLSGDSDLVMISASRLQALIDSDTFQIHDFMYVGPHSLVVPNGSQTSMFTDTLLSLGTYMAAAPSKGYLV